MGMKLFDFYCYIFCSYSKNVIEIFFTIVGMADNLPELVTPQLQILGLNVGKKLMYTFFAE